LAANPGGEIRVLINRDDRDARPLVARGLPPGAAFRHFPNLDALVTELAALEHLYVTDTGLYHLAVAMGVPCTVFYGPTQPWRNGFPEQPDLARVRLAALAGEHCEEKGCLPYAFFFSGGEPLFFSGCVFLLSPFFSSISLISFLVCSIAASRPAFLSLSLRNSAYLSWRFWRMLLRGSSSIGMDRIQTTMVIRHSLYPDNLSAQ